MLLPVKDTIKPTKVSEFNLPVFENAETFLCIPSCIPRCLVFFKYYLIISSYG